MASVEQSESKSKNKQWRKSKKNDRESKKTTMEGGAENLVNTEESGTVAEGSSRKSTSPKGGTKK